ncbi:MAG TPA: hypothetical protein VFU81_19515, partial [Thermomicrobiales bacterium]|nr:hypothetical protein [Thermomicrobiales bacterium]
MANSGQRAPAERTLAPIWRAPHGCRQHGVTQLWASQQAWPAGQSAFVAHVVSVPVAQRKLLLPATPPKQLVQPLGHTP